VLDRIELSGFKSIRQMDLELSRLNVLGANGAGKSNLISAGTLGSSPSSKANPR
jgi:predicted ATPase